LSKKGRTPDAAFQTKRSFSCARSKGRESKDYGKTSARAKKSDSKKKT